MTIIINYITVIIFTIITIILIKNSNNNILFKKKQKTKFLAYCPKVTLVGTGFEPGTFESPTYQALTISAIPTTCVSLCF